MHEHGERLAVQLVADAERCCSTLERGIARAMARLAAERGRDVERFRRTMTSRQATLASAFRGEALGQPGVHHERISFAVSARERHLRAERVGARVGQALRRLAPREFRDLAGLLEHPGAHALRALGRAYRDVVLGRDGAER